jgi:ABC-type sugar transport system ATPase subunit
VPPRLAVRDLAKHYGGVQALRGVTLQVAAGEVVAVVGDNGAGKSTLLKILAGAASPSAGQVFLDGRPVQFGHPAAAHEAGIATVYQDLALAGQRDVVANFFLGREKLSRSWLGRRVGWLDGRAMAEHTVSELARLRTRIPDVHLASRDLSGGQRQALAIARAAGWARHVLLLDEPTSALDPGATESIEGLIRTLTPQLTVIIVTHNLAQASRVADMTIFLNQGRMVECGETKQVFEHPAEEETARYVGGRFG